MIYWINGAYGVGKSTVAEQLRAKLPKAHIFDAEEVGNAVRDNYPEECKHSIIFEGYPALEGAELQTVEGYKQQIRWRHYCADDACA